MASIRSLGIYRPSSVAYLISEEILPPEPTAGSYRHKSHSVENADGIIVDEELVITDDCVVWSREGVIEQLFRFGVDDEAVVDAVFTRFRRPVKSPAHTSGKRNDESSKTSKPRYEKLQVKKTRTAIPDGEKQAPSKSGQNTSSKLAPSWCRALVIVLKTKIHIHLISETSHVVHIPSGVDAVFSSLDGVVLQRTPRRHAPLTSPDVPQAPTNTFAFSQQSSQSANDRLTPGLQPQLNGRALTYLDKARILTTSSAQPELPSLFCITDPLAQLGIVAIDTDQTGKTSSDSHVKLSADERLLYTSPNDELKQLQSSNQGAICTVAVTLNVKNGTTNLWLLSPASSDENDIHGKPLNRTSSRRRSSFTSRLSTGATTPVARSFRQFSRENDLLEPKVNPETQILDSVFDQTIFNTKNSRRVSSLLARADLSTEQDRNTFSDFPKSAHGSRKSRRGPSFGLIGSLGDVDTHHRKSFYDIQSSLDSVSLSEMPLGQANDVLDDVHDPESLTEDQYWNKGQPLRPGMYLKRLYSLVQDQSIASPSGDSHQTRCFTLENPTGNLHNPGAGGFLVCVLYRELESLLIFQVSASARQKRRNSPRNGALTCEDSFDLKISGSRRSGILDACKIKEGAHEWILVLDSKGHSLTLQAPWSPLVKLELPSPFNFFNAFNLSPSRSRENDKGSRRTISLDPKQIVSVEQANDRGKINLIDREGQHHAINIQLAPSSEHVLHLIRICDAVLQNPETMLRGWLDVMAWLGSREEDENEKEMVAFKVILFSLALAFIKEKKSDVTPRQRRRKGGLLRSSSGAITDLESWNEMMSQTCNRADDPSSWLGRQGAWTWTKDTLIFDQDTTTAVPFPKKLTSISNCVSLAREFLKSNPGQAAIGKNGYLATATSRESSSRQTSIPAILVALHLYREELKLNTLSATQAHTLTPILIQLGSWVAWTNWSCHANSWYMLESNDLEAYEFDDSHITDLRLPPEPFPPPSILAFLESKILKKDTRDFPSLKDVVGLSDDLFSQQQADSALLNLTPRTTIILLQKLRIQDLGSTNLQVDDMVSAGITKSFLETLPESISTPFCSALATFQLFPSSDWRSQILDLVDREDIAYLENGSSPSKSSAKEHHPGPEIAIHDVHYISAQAMEAESTGPYEGSAEIDRQSVTRLLFKDDQRFAEAVNLVHPLNNPVASCVPEPGWIESDLLEAQQELAKIVALRTLSVSLGRSLIFYGARLPLLTEKFPIHGFTLSCIMKPSNTTVTADKALFTEERVSWAFFNAGVESGLSISKSAAGIDTSWILFNKPKDLTHRHAGFLLALGLNGHLRKMAKWVAFKYLTPKHNVTSIGLLLGLSASHIGTMDTLITKLLSVHVTRMLPPGAAELNLSPLTQTCGIFGIGLLYCNTQHRRMSEIMLSELENMDLEEGTNPGDALRDEGYRLVAGFSLGLINLGHGLDLKGLQDMRITERLLSLAVAIKVVDRVHVSDSTGAGATMALALIFMKTNDRALARKIDVPDTAHQFDYVRPDQFLLRTVTKHLIMWDEIRGTQDWILTQTPISYQGRNLYKVPILSSEDLPLLNILAGLCFAIGLRFAGSGDERIRDLLCQYLDQFVWLCRLPTPTYDAKLARITLRNCQDLLALCAACVVAGTGDLVILRRLRSLHGRTDPETPYGSHLASHLAIGILFLGGGTYTFNTSNLAIAALLTSFYPLFPASVLDNKSHLQALRHFWVLAAQPRCLVPRDLDTHRPLSLPIAIVYKDGHSTNHTAPCLLPDLDTVAQIHTLDAGFWPVTLDLAENTKHLSAFRRHQSIFLRRRDAHDLAATSVFSSTMRVLQDQATVQVLRSQPFEWLFSLPALKDLDRTERALLLPSQNAGTGSIRKAVRGTVVDDRLMLETGCLRSGRSERLWNLRLLLAWADACERQGQTVGWVGRDVVEGLRARIALESRSHR